MEWLVSFYGHIKWVGKEANIIRRDMYHSNVPL